MLGQRSQFPRSIGLVVIAMTFCSCSGSDPNIAEFFRGDAATRVSRMAAYSLEQQYQLFLYGNQNIEPPATDMAIPIAGKGAVAVPYILGQLKSAKADMDYRDSLVIFDQMKRMSSFDVCAREDLLRQLVANEKMMKDPRWQFVYRNMLRDLCNRP